MFKRGDIREDGFMFLTYENRNGRIYEKWMSPDAFANKQAYQKEWAKANRGRVRDDPVKHAKANEYAKNAATKYRIGKPENMMLSHAKARAKRKGLEFAIDISDIVIPKHCPVLGIPIGKQYGNANDNSAELDRVDNSKGYIRGNIMIISRRANRIKNDASVLELMMLSRFYQELFKKKPITFDIAKLRMLLD